MIFLYSHCPQPSHFQVATLTFTPPITHCLQHSHSPSPLNLLLHTALDPHTPHCPSTSYCTLPSILIVPIALQPPITYCPQHSHYPSPHNLQLPIAQTLTFPIITQLICNSNKVNILNSIYISIVLKININ